MKVIAINDKVYYIDFNGVEYLATIEQTNQPSTFWMNDEYYTISLEYGKIVSFVTEKCLRPDWRIRDKKLEQLGL